MHPDSSTWDEVVAKAEVIEIADNVMDRRDGPRPLNRKGWRPNTFDNNGNKKNQESASRSMTYMNRDRDNNRSNNSRDNEHTRNGSQSHSQARQGSAQTSKKHFQGRSASRPRGTGGSSSGPKKSVKFADLSEQEMAQLRAEGKCFLCKEPGHMSRNCPRKNTVRGNGNNKPPGLPSFSMTMDILEDDSEKDSVLKSMPVGVVSIASADESSETPDSDETWSKWYPLWQNPQAHAEEEIGNCYEMTADSLLTKFQPYPGDDLVKSFMQPEDCFTVEQSIKNSEVFTIHDSFNGFETTLNKASLADPKFNLIHWYARTRARALNLPKPSKKEYPQQLGNPVVTVTTSLLKSGEQSFYPNMQAGSWRQLVLRVPERLWQLPVCHSRRRSWVEA